MPITTTSKAVAGLALASALFSLPESALGHGGLVKPAARNAAYQQGFTSVPINYDWMSLNCGGVSNVQQWQTKLSDADWNRQPVSVARDRFYGHGGVSCLERTGFPDTYVSAK